MTQKTNIDIPSSQEKDFSPEEKPSVVFAETERRPLKRPVMMYKIPAGSASTDTEEGFWPSEYPLIDIGAAEDTDSFVYQAILKKLALGMKEGFSFIGENPDVLAYVKTRIRQMEIVQGKTFWKLISELLAGLFRYHNIYLIKKRDVERSGGKVRFSGNREIAPVAAYFIASPDTMEVRISKNQIPDKYKHVMPDGRSIILRAEDVIHFEVNRKPHFLTATPPWHPVIEDVQALRRIEENIENLIYQHLYPLYQYKIGTPERPMQRFEDGTTEVDIVRAKLANMPPDGMIFTPERHEISGLGSESRALRAENYLEHFKARVIAGTGMSQLDFGYGDTANRSTADSLSKTGTGNVKFIQQCLTDTFNSEVLREILLESTFSIDVLAPENIVELQFEEIDLEAQIKKQNHAMLLFNGNLVTHTEARALANYEAMTEEQMEDTYMHKFSIAETEETAEIEAKHAPTPAPTASGAKPTSSAVRAAKSKQQPSNQHGKASGPTAAKSSVMRDSRVTDTFSELLSDLQRMNKRNISLDFVRQIFVSSREQAKERIKSAIQDNTFLGARVVPFTTDLLNQVRAAQNTIYQDYAQDIEKLFDEGLRETTKAFLNEEDFLDHLESIQYRLKFIDNTCRTASFNIGRQVALRANGQEFAVIRSDPDGSDHKIWDGVVIALSDRSILPPFHPNCRCTIEPQGAIP